MLLLVGLGLETKDLSVRALEEIKTAKLLFLEEYTSFLSKDYLRFIGKETRKTLDVVSRQDLEERVKEIVKKAKNAKIAILVPGDPLIATTHSIILNEAEKQGIECLVLHSSSILSAAIGESGLDAYKFGPVVTIPFWFANYKPTSFLDVLEKNMKNNEHTLLLLDIDQKNKRPMKIEEAVEVLNKAESARGSEGITDDLKVIVLADVGKKTQDIRYLKLGGLTKKIKEELDGKVLSLIIPAQLSFAEKESLDRVSKNPV
ncbi:MAG: diphthine synthase [Candidatus Micrarchaeales archaeon]